MSSMLGERGRGGETGGAEKIQPSILPLPLSMGLALKGPASAEELT